MRLEEHIVNGHDFGDEGNGGGEILRVKQVETVNELEGWDDEGQPQPRALREHAMMFQPAHAQEPFGRAWLKAIDLELVVFVDERHKRTDELDQIRAAALRFAVQVVGVDADPHRFKALPLPLLTGLLLLRLSPLLGAALLAKRARLTKAALSGRARAWIAKAGLTRQARSRLARHDLTRHARATRRAEAKARETGRRRQTLKRTRVLLILARKALLSR